MKQIIIIIILLMAFAALNCNAQDSEYLKLWGNYVDECSEIVRDTMTETGIVTYEILLKEGDLKLVPKDTIWNIIECPKYKENKGGDNILYFNSTLDAHSIYIDHFGALGGQSISNPTKNTFETKIKRTKICNYKLRKPDKDNFWEWLKTNRHRK